MAVNAKVWLAVAVAVAGMLPEPSLAQPSEVQCALARRQGRALAGCAGARRPADRTLRPEAGRRPPPVRAADTPRRTRRPTPAQTQPSLDELVALARRHATGVGVPQNIQEAARLYRLAADRGHPGARLLLGQLLFGVWAEMEGTYAVGDSELIDIYWEVPGTVMVERLFFPAGDIFGRYVLENDDRIIGNNRINANAPYAVRLRRFDDSTGIWEYPGGRLVVSRLSPGRYQFRDIRGSDNTETRRWERRRVNTQEADQIRARIMAARRTAR